MASDTAKNKHEHFEVRNNVIESKRLKVVRQDRLINHNEEIYLEINTQKYEVINFSTFGVAIKVPKDLKVVSEYEGIFIYNNIEIATVRLRLIRLETDSLTENSIAFEIIGEPLNINTINAVKLAKDVIDSHTDDRVKESEIPFEFRKIVYELKDSLTNLKNKLDQIELEVGKYGNRYADEYRDTIALVTGKYLFDIIPPLYNKASQALEGIESEKRKMCMLYFRSKLGELLYKAPIVDRIFNRPLGYAGDYEMMNIIYKTQAIGGTLFDKCIHNLFIRDPAASAVRNRATYLTKKLKHEIGKAAGKKLKLLSVACGPAMEIQNILQSGFLNQDSIIEIHLLDQDESALKNAQFEIKKLAKYFPNIKIEYIHLAIKNVIARGLPHSDYDIIYSAGLYDYFSEPVAHLTTEQLINSLKETGKLIIGNFNTTNPSKAVMEIALDWNLIYRSENELQKMYSHYGQNLEIEKEELGINLFCVITK